MMRLLIAARLLLIGGLALGMTAWAQADPAATPRVAPLQAIAALDLPRYMGRWHELARYPNRFQQQCTGSTTADYRLLADGHVEVVNRCRLADGGVDQAVGSGRLVGGAGSARLQVRFAPKWLGWLPFVWGDYWVVDLDPAYQLAIVSEPQRDYLWVLSRTPQVDADTWRAVEQRLTSLGFDPARLLKSEGAGALP